MPSSCCVQISGRMPSVDECLLWTNLVDELRLTGYEMIHQAFQRGFRVVTVRGELAQPGKIAAPTTSVGQHPASLFGRGRSKRFKGLSKRGLDEMGLIAHQGVHWTMDCKGSDSETKEQPYFNRKKKDFLSLTCDL